MFDISDKSMEWIRPVIVFVIGAIIIKLISCAVAGNLKGTQGKITSVESRSKYKIVCPFEIKNSGFMEVKSRKFQINLPDKVRIHDAKVDQDYKCVCNEVDGGFGHCYVIYLIEGLKGQKSIKGHIIFHQNDKWDERLPPLKFSE